MKLYDHTSGQPQDPVADRQGRVAAENEIGHPVVACTACLSLQVVTFLLGLGK
jgi:hypothetical protein